MWYILKDKVPVPVDDILQAAEMFDSKTRIVARTKLTGGIVVSTVFLGIDHRFGDGPPLVFETMIFGGKHDEYQDRYSTWEEAEAGHVVAVALADGDRWNWFVSLWWKWRVRIRFRRLFAKFKKGY